MHPEILTPFLLSIHHIRVVTTEVQNLLAGLKQKHFSSEVSSTLGKSTHTGLIQVMTHFPTVQEVFNKSAILH